jgi:peptidoglycan/LPS O-acetylase OafA/YrhL
VRGIAVVAVLFFHAGFSWAKGGWLGVSVFFTLSGFLITSLLLRDWEKHGRILFGTFYSRRARRLLPAALVTLAAVSLLAPALASSNQLRHLRADVLGSVGYVANWRFLFSHTSYADLFSAPSPVQHFWSLAIEEQFYLVYPLVAYLALRLGGRRLLGAVLVTGTIGSVVWSLHLHAALDRVYYGTDTRAAELLLGGLLALSWFGLVPAGERVVRAGRQWGQWGQWGVALVGFAGLIGTLVLCDTMAETSSWVTHGLLPLQAVLSAAMIAAAARTGPVARTLSWRPLAAIGRVSSGR